MKKFVLLGLFLFSMSTLAADYSGNYTCTSASGKVMARVKLADMENYDVSKIFLEIGGVRTATPVTRSESSDAVRFLGLGDSSDLLAFIFFPGQAGPHIYLRNPGREAGCTKN